MEWGPSWSPVVPFFPPCATTTRTITLTTGDHEGPHPTLHHPRPYAIHGGVEKTYPCKRPRSPGRVPLFNAWEKCEIVAFDGADKHRTVQVFIAALARGLGDKHAGMAGCCVQREVFLTGVFRAQGV